MFEKPFVESKVMPSNFNLTSSILSSTPPRSQIHTHSPSHSLPPKPEKNSRESLPLPKEPLSEHRSNHTKLGELQRSSILKSNKLLNIPELPEEDSRTPQYVQELRKENGEDVKKSGLNGLPRKLESVAAFAINQYLKDLL